MWCSIRSGEEAGRTFELTGERYVVGREEGCELVLASDEISRRHAALERLPDGRYSLTDLGSANGTFVGGQRIAGSVVLEGGEELRFGDTVVAVARTEAELAGTASAGPRPTVAARPAAPPAPPPGRAGGWLRRNRLAVAAVAGLAALAGLGAGLGIALSGGPDDAAAVTVTLSAVTVVVTEATGPVATIPPATGEPPRETTAPVETEAPPEETEEPAPDDDGAQAGGSYEELLGHVPEAIRVTCIPIEELPQDALAGANCGVGSAGVGAALYFQFASAEAATGWYELNFVDARDTGDCVEQEYSEGSWSIEGEPQGRLACGSADQFRSIGWTTDSLAIGVVAFKQGEGRALRQELYDFWLVAGPE
ncbi:MAG: FHA domain-containing protein [Thermoleophilia bacterium]|nr:FHA domain-containing protein [Thermoleophilia bacterium]